MFAQINSPKKKTGVIAPELFAQRLKKQNELFRSYMHQEAKFAKSGPETSPSEKAANGPSSVQSNTPRKEPLVTWVHKNFQNSSIGSCLKNFSSMETLNAEENSSVTNAAVYWKHKRE